MPVGETGVEPVSENTVVGKVVQVIGATIDAEYPEGHLPPNLQCIED